MLTYGIVLVNFNIKGASIDPRSPGGQGLTRTPIVLKTQNDQEEVTERKNEGNSKIEKEKIKPMRGTAGFADKVLHSSEIEVRCY